MENHSLHCSFPCFARPSGLSSIKHNIMQRKLKKIQSCITIQRAFRSVLFRNHINNMIKTKKVSATIIQDTYVKFRNNEEEIFNIKTRKNMKKKSRSRIIQNKYKKCLAKRKKLRYVSALKIQIIYKIYKARQFLNTHLNVIKIQNLFRTYKAKKITHIIRRNNIIKNVKISFCNALNTHIKKRNLSALLIQNTFNNYIHNKKINQENIDLKIQRCYHQYLIEMDDLVII